MEKGVLIAYTKKFRKHLKFRATVEVQGNALLLIEEEIIARYGIPTVDSARFLATEVKNYAYVRNPNSNIIEVPGHQRLVVGTKSPRNIVRLPGPSGVDRTSAIRFPSFFNVSMISQALKSMIKIQKISKWKLDRTGGKEYYISSSSDYWGKAWLTLMPVAAKGTRDWPWGEIVVVRPVVSRSRTLNNF